MSIKIGTRGSKLALWQANHVKVLLENSGKRAELVLYKTTGDLRQSQPLHTIGEKGLFTKALDDALLNGEVDLAVHSAKDVPTVLPDGLIISAYLQREDPRDVLLALSPEVDLDNLSREFVVGTSSLRRVALLRHYAPHFKPRDIRGNVDTRMAKLEAGEYDALVLAYAGVKRMGFTDKIVRKLRVSTFTPAVGQGAIAVMTNQNNQQVNEMVRSLLNHPVTEDSVKSERSFLRKLEGGCHTPIFALATWVNGNLSLSGGVAAEDGSTLFRETIEGPAAHAEKIGVSLAEIILNKGARKILNG
ncbi:MAG TPA: hydroxymethylbilane synthase [Bacteroidetes bacterium]|nr:hydroxymethylbilane synthase [Bacteroidota bacterium]